MAQAVLWIGVLPLVIVIVVIIFAIPLGATIKDLETPLHPGADDRCPTCGILVSPHHNWISQVRHGDGRTVFFVGCKGLFKYLLSLDQYPPGKIRRNVVSVFVTNYYDGEVIAARTALFVVGSDTLGPVGHDLVPHSSYEAAEYFRRDHYGRRILRFDEITEAILHELM